MSDSTISTDEPPKENIDSFDKSTIKQIRKARVSLAHQKKKIQEWTQQNNQNIDTNALAARYRDISRQVERELLPVVLDYCAWVHGVQRVNEALKYGLNLDGVALSESEADSICDKMLSLSVLDNLLSHTELRVSQKKEIRHRFLQKVFPIESVKKDIIYPVSDRGRNATPDKVVVKNPV